MLVREWMTPDPQTVNASTPVMEAMQRLREGGFRRLPVVQNGKLIGIVTGPRPQGGHPLQGHHALHLRTELPT